MSKLKDKILDFIKGTSKKAGLVLWTKRTGKIRDRIMETSGNTFRLE